MYYSVADIANHAGVSKDWIHRMILTGHLQKRWFGKFYVLDDNDIAIIRGLRGRGVFHLPAPQFTGEPVEVAFTVERAATMAGVGPSIVRNLAETKRIDAQRFGRGWMIFPAAIEQIKNTPALPRRSLPLTYRTNTGNPKPIPPLSDRYKRVVAPHFAGVSIAELARSPSFSTR